MQAARQRGQEHQIFRSPSRAGHLYTLVHSSLCCPQDTHTVYAVDLSRIPVPAGQRLSSVPRRPDMQKPYHQGAVGPCIAASF